MEPVHPARQERLIIRVGPVGGFAHVSHASFGVPPAPLCLSCLGLVLGLFVSLGERSSRCLTTKACHVGGRALLPQRMRSQCRLVDGRGWDGAVGHAATVGLL